MIGHSWPIVALYAWLGLSGTMSKLVAWSHDPQLSIRPGQAYYSQHPFTGLVYEFHPNHVPARLMFFWQGREVGTERQWYPNGHLWSEREYRSGIAHGRWRLWAPDGRLQYVSYYFNGGLNKAQRFP